ncbi:hypothetical protein [Streptomyces sp. NPDC005385]|uniref:hypothetical protein n=1 Tax=Streptomyces sp. NPDC005385 TaxID=3157039 RepID=UPI0033A8F0DD
MTPPEDAIEARPRRESDGPRLEVWTWLLSDPPALWLRQKATWRWASVTARQDWPDGRIAYQVLIDTNGTTSKSTTRHDSPDGASTGPGGSEGRTTKVRSQAFAMCSRKGEAFRFINASRRNAPSASIHSTTSSGSVYG